MAGSGSGEPLKGLMGILAEKNSSVDFNLQSSSGRLGSGSFPSASVRLALRHLHPVVTIHVVHGKWIEWS